ncbi:MAG: hypothetical protein JGK24_28110 [Microcoleus sp. PH2017_29_MFU_D_A]|uniref:hypothetical protein n=1 Tax=Microcoleus sp. PH2017_29_MFU_D_A TaxID=2798839 RepID=UPI001DCA0E32|nr:hypothetical protein [Microcoleus sp. PH2017_29_MFU_D_A]MCC3606983.1 hypothetical protein [Microcoleus sp. PH2017_29_MFU_D_A]
MATVTFPSSPNPNGMSWRLIMPSQTNISDWTGRRQTIASGRGWWECQLSLPPIVGTANVNAWRSFIAKSRGRANDFQIPVDATAQSAATATPLVNGAGQTGRTLATDGWPLSSTVLVAGQFVTINNQLLQLTENVTSNGSGVATLTFEPPIRTSPADNAAIEYKNPYCLMHFVEEPTLSVENGYVYSLSLNLRESF